MSKIHRLCTRLALSAVAGLVLASSPPGAKPKPVSLPPDQPVATAGLRVHLDPATGRIVPPPARAAASPAGRAMFSSSHQGLVEERGTTAAGGFKVESRGQFQTAVLVRVGPDGKPVLTCVEGAATTQTR